MKIETPNELDLWMRVWVACAQCSNVISTITCTKYADVAVKEMRERLDNPQK